MIIEFVGVPGAGKNTLVPTAKEVFNETGLKAMSILEAAPYCLKRMFVGRIICFFTPSKWQNRILYAFFRRLILLYRLKFVFKNNTLSWDIINSVFRRRISWNETRAILRWVFRDVSYYQFFQNRLRSDEVLILDEGVIQRATTLYAMPFKDPDACKVRWYIRQIPQADLLIWVEAPLDICTARVISRGTNTRYVGQELKSFIGNSAKVLEIATQAMKGVGWDIIRVDNGDNLDKGITELRSILVEKSASWGVIFQDSVKPNSNFKVL